MKFTDGYWQVREGMTPYFPAEVYEVEIESEAMTIYAPTKKLVSRGDTLNLPLLTVRFSSPMDNVIRVQIFHHKGGLSQKP
jgi:alpha-D-xyloside xylohydrolase